MTRRILLFEFLLAEEMAWEDSSKFMKAEAIAMLTALAMDFSLLPDIEPTLLLSSRSCRSRRFWDQLQGRFRIVEAESGPAQWLNAHAEDARSYDAMMLIAPECNNILVSLLQQIECGPWRHVHRLNLDSQNAATFSDKKLTAEWLRHHGITTPETKAIGSQCATEILSRRTQTTEHCVLKPRCGAGSDRVNVICMGQDEFNRIPEEANAADAEWVLQPFIPGAACSIGLIGGGMTQPTTMLPGARQHIERHNDQLVYVGGSVPCETALDTVAGRVARHFAAAMGPFSGYLGIDVVISQAAGAQPVPQVIEINPRLCTSYIGYQALCRDNLASCLMQKSAGETLRWNNDAVSFTHAGEVLPEQSHRGTTFHREQVCDGSG